MKTRTSICAALCACVAVSALARVSDAQVCAKSLSNTSSEEGDVWATHGCWQEYFLWQYQAFDLQYSDWSGKSWGDACNLTGDFPKHWNATYLINYGLSDNLSAAFHGTSDYEGLTQKFSSGYHGTQRHLMGGYNAGLLGLYQVQPIAPNRLNTYCNLYDKLASSGGANATPSARSGVMVHEGTHGWWRKLGTFGGNCGSHHCANEFADKGGALPGSCASASCDYFYWHRLSQYAFGYLWYQDGAQGTGKYFHSPFQNELEYLCDLADTPASDVPASTVLNATSVEGFVAGVQLVSGSAYRCGNPRPW